MDASTNSSLSAAAMITGKSLQLASSIEIGQLKTKMSKDELYKLIRVAMAEMYVYGHERGLRDLKLRK